VVAFLLWNPATWVQNVLKNRQEMCS